MPFGVGNRPRHPVIARQGPVTQWPVQNGRIGAGARADQPLRLPGPGAATLSAA